MGGVCYELSPLPGLWYYLPGEELPSLSLVGSSNYGEETPAFSFGVGHTHTYIHTYIPVGHRSLTRDLEAQVAIVTTNQQLRQSLHDVSCMLNIYYHEWGIQVYLHNWHTLPTGAKRNVWLR